MDPFLLPQMQTQTQTQTQTKPQPKAVALSIDICRICREPIDTTYSAYVTYATCNHKAHFTPCAELQLALHVGACACRAIDLQQPPADIDYGFDRAYSEKCVLELVSRQMPLSNAPVKVTPSSLLSSLTNIRDTLFTQKKATTVAPLPLSLSYQTLETALKSRMPTKELKDRGFMLSMLADSRLPVDFFFQNNYSLIDLHMLGVTQFDWLVRAGLRLNTFITYRSTLPIDVLVQDYGVNFTHLINMPRVSRETPLMQLLKAIRFSREEFGALRFQIQMLLAAKPTLADIKALGIDISDAFQYYGFNCVIYYELLERTHPDERMNLWDPAHVEYWLTQRK